MSLPGPLELILIIVVLVLLFGAGRIPRLMEDVAKGIQSFKKGIRDDASPTVPPDKTDSSSKSE